MAVEHWRSTGGGFSQFNISQFLGGNWIPIKEVGKSTNVVEAMYDPEFETLSIGFQRANEIIRYYALPNCGVREAYNFARAKSKGGWWWDNVIRLNREVYSIGRS